MNVIAIGKGAVGTRYIAERDANQEREGNHRRPLFSLLRKDLTPAEANHVLSDGRGKPDKRDLRHIVISPESARAYESLGDTDDERKENFLECARATMTRFAESLGVRELRWIAGIHLNTDHPHVHILLHKDAIDAATGRPTRIKHIPQEWLMHNETVPVERPAPPVEQAVKTEPEAENATAAAGEGGEESKAGEISEKIVAYQAAQGSRESYQQFKGTYLTLEKLPTREGEREDRKVAVAVETKDVYDPKGILEGTDQARSAADEERMLERLSGVPLHSFRDTQTAILVEYGYQAAVDWEGSERDANAPRRELTVFDASRVSHVVEASENTPEREGREEVAEAPEPTVRVNYGKLGVYFGEEIDKRAYPVRQIAFHIDHSEDFTRRDLLDPTERKPTDTERLVGRWVMMEARLNGHEDRGTRILRLRLREEVARLDAAALERSAPQPKAFIPTHKLHDAIAENQISVLRADGSLSPRYHTSEPTRAELARARILDLQPSHGGEIYGLVATDSGRIIAREVVTVGPHLRMPVQAPAPTQTPTPAPAEKNPTQPAAAHNEQPRAQPEPAPQGTKEEPRREEASRVREVEGRAGVGWALNLYVEDEQRAAVVEALPALREKYHLQFSFSAAVQREEEGRVVIASLSDRDGKEIGREEKAQAQDLLADDRLILIHAGARDNTELVAGAIHRELSESLSEPPRIPIAGEELDEPFQERVVGYFQIRAVDQEFSDFTKRGVPFTKDDYERIMSGRRAASAAGTPSLRELREEAVKHADGLLRERYGAFYAGGSYVAPERAEQQQHEAARPQEEQPRQQEEPHPFEPQALRGNKGGWIHVTPDSRCPVCNKADNCAVSTDGKRAYCRRVESGRQGRDGGYIHDLTKLADYVPQEHEPTGPAVVQYEKRPVEDRDRINRKIQEALRLEKRDLDNLLGRGLTEEAIERDGYVSVPVRAQANQIAERLAAEGEDLRGVPGFWKATDEEGQSKWQLNLNYWYRGIMVPVTDAQGHVDGFQIRRAEVKGDEPKYVWLSSKSRDDSPKPEGTPSGAPVHFKNVEKIRESREAILTEGSLKANIISNYLDRGVVAIAGVSVFQDDFGEKLKQDVPELERVWIAYDADAAEKKEVKKALERVAAVLSKAGLEVGVLSWQIEEGKGLDDYLQNKLGADFHSVQGQEREEQQFAALAGVGWTEGEIPAERRPPTPPVTLQPGVIDAATGREVTEDELTVSHWLHEEARAAEEGHTKDLRGLRDRVGEIDREATEGRQPEVPAVMLPSDLQTGLESGKLLTHEQLIAHQRTQDRVTLGKELAARLELVHAGEKYNRCLEQAETRRYRVLDASTNLTREMSARDIEQRAQARSYRAADERADEVERAEPRDRTDVRNGIKQEVVSNDLADHETTVEAIIRKHAEQLSGLEKTLRRTYIEHDDLAPQAHAVERAYRARGEELPPPLIPEETLDRLHDQALERRDADTIKYLNDVRTGIAEERGEPARDDERAARLSAQHNVANGDLKVAQRRAEEFRESSHNRKWEIEGETKKWSLSDVDKEQARKERELEYLSTSGRFFGSRGIAVQLFKQQVLMRVNPINSLRLSSLSPLYPIKHHPVVKAVRIGIQIYKWYERGKEAEALSRAASETIEQMKVLRPQVQEKIDARQQELSNEISTQTRVAETLGQIQDQETAARAVRSLEPAQAKYSDWELRRLETNSMELRDGEMLREYERAATQRVTEEVGKLTSDLAAGKTPEEAARELVENRIKDAMRQLEPTAKQIHRLSKEGADVPLNRMLASEKIEELTGEEAVWKTAGRAAVEELKASGQPLTPESFLEAHRTAFGGRAVAREIVTDARMREAANRLEQFREFREITQIRYTTPEGAQEIGNLKETEPKSWLDRLKNWISEDPSNAAKREAVERALGEEEARLRTAHEEARDFHQAARDIAEDYRAQLPGEELQPQFTSKEAAELERFGGGLRPDELNQLEQLATLTEQQAEQVQFSRIIQDALTEGRVANDPGAQSSQRTQGEKSPAEREADPVERQARELAENPELSESLTTEASGGAEATATVEAEAEIEESLGLLL